MYGFHLYIVVVIKMAQPQDDYDQAMPAINMAPTRMRLTQSSMKGSQYLLNFEDEQENASEVYLLLILHLLYIYEIKHSSNNSYICIYVLQNLCVSTYVALWIDDVDE